MSVGQITVEGTVRGDAATLAAVTARLTDGHIVVRVAAMHAIPKLAEKGNAAAIAALEAILHQDTDAMTDVVSNDAEITDLVDPCCAISHVKERGFFSNLEICKLQICRVDLDRVDRFAQVRAKRAASLRVFVSQVKHTALEILGKIANEADMKRIHADLEDEISKITRFPTLPLPRWPTSNRRRRIAERYNLREQFFVKQGETLDAIDAELFMMTGD